MIYATVPLAIGALWLLIRRLCRERQRPPLPCVWRERDFGDHPNVSNLFHFGTGFSTGAERDVM